jgi:hypothetical protein
MKLIAHLLMVGFLSAPALAVEPPVVAPSETVEIRDLKMTLVAGPVNGWRDGNRLIMGENLRRNVLPGSYVPGSLQLRTPDGRVLESPRDYTIDQTWGAFALADGASVKPGDQVLATYRYSLRRVDALVIHPDGRVEVVRGEPSVDCPPLPKIPDGVVHVTNIFRPFNAGPVKPAHVYPIPLGGVPASRPSDELPTTSPALEQVLAKLRSGGEVTVVCWGDSVTEGGDVGPPGTKYVERLDVALKERFPKARIRVINAGIGGTTTAGRLPNFDAEVLAHKPDVVTLEFVNDMSYPLEAMQKRYTEVLERTSRAGAALIIITPHMVMPSWMPNLPEGRGPDRRVNVEFLRRFARTHGIPVADAARRWEALELLGIPYEIYLRNGINHPDDRAHVWFTEEIMKLFPAE